MMLGYVYSASMRITLSYTTHNVCLDTLHLLYVPAAACSFVCCAVQDMGGAALMLSLAHVMMSHRLPVRLRVLVPAVENAISGNAYRPLDVLRTRAGISVEVR